jgi:hypothetical protein
VPRGGHPAYRHRRAHGSSRRQTTLTVYAHLINTDDHTGNMAALGALAAPVQNTNYGNVIPLCG